MQFLQAFVRRWRLSFGAWLMLGNLLLTAAVGLATLRTLQYDEAVHLETSRRAVSNLADSVGAEVAAELRLVDNALMSLRGHVQADDVDARHPLQPGLQRELQAQQALVPFVTALRLADTQGQVLREQAGEDAVDISDRAYFRVALASDAVAVSEPLVSRITGRWSLLVARRLVDAEGQAMAVAYAVIDASHFSDLFARFQLGGSGAMALRTAAGRLVARHSQAEPGSQAGLGTDTISSGLAEALARGDAAGLYEAPTAIDGIARINAYRRLPGFDLVLLAGLGSEDVRGPTRLGATRHWLFVAAMLLLLWGGSLFVYRQHGREHRALLQSGRLAAERERAHLQERGLKEQVQALATELADLYDHAPCAYYSLDAQGHFCRVNAVLCQWLSCTEAELLAGRGPVDFFDEASAARFRENFPRFLQRGEIGPLEFDVLAADGTRRHVSVRATGVRNAAGEVVRSRSVMYDITELDSARQALRTLAAEQGAMLSNDLIGILRLKQRRITWSNPASERMFGYPSGALNGLDVRDLYPSTAAFEAFGHEAYATLDSGRTFRAQVQLVRRDGQPLIVDVSGARLSGTPDEYLWMSLDITEMKRQHERIAHVAFHDGLTGLPNRALMMDRLHQAIELCRRTQELLVVCFLDLDGFKDVNDAYGHAAGDQLLQEVARRLSGQVRAYDTAARVGGDEFVVLMTSLRSVDEAVEAMARIALAIDAPVSLAGGHVVRVRASVGWSQWPKDGDDEDSLLRAADRAMYVDKSAHAPADRGSGRQSRPAELWGPDPA